LSDASGDDPAFLTLGGVHPPVHSSEMLLFGGEYFDGENAWVYNGVYRWNLDRGDWRQIESLNTPPPRCSHQVRAQRILYRVLCVAKEKGRHGLWLRWAYIRGV
jgi:hypothetical protein